MKTFSESFRDHMLKKYAKSQNVHYKKNIVDMCPQIYAKSQNVHHKKNYSGHFHVSSGYQMNGWNTDM